MKKITAILGILLICVNLQAKTYKVGTPEEYKAAVKKAAPGDSIVLANGVWKDVKLVFKGEGTKEMPITLTVETPGQCTLQGLSNLRISGNYLVVDGLVFINGYTPSTYVIEFKTADTQIARNCMVKRCVVDRYNHPDKTKMDNWMNLCGQYNKVYNCYFGGKKNQGTTFIVSPNGEGHTENYHHVYRNHFGPRPKLGANGGETIRIGTSHFSMENSNTIIEGNFFEHCNGETEIISVKSCENRIVNNTFWECEGSVVLRHGHRNEVSGNYILGNGKPYTGGIRVINESHKIYNNYLSGLRGVDFRAPLVIMNGVLNSPLNRYNQVKDVDIAFNTFVDCALPWQLCVGSDAERTERPANVKIANNIVYSPAEDELIKAFDKTDGITFLRNVLQSSHGIEKGTGFLQAEIKVRRDRNGIILPLVSAPLAEGFAYVDTDIDGRQRASQKALGAFDLTSGGKETVAFADKTNCGPGFAWRTHQPAANVVPAIHKVTPGKDNLYKAIRKSNPGDIIELQEQGEYVNTRKMQIHHTLHIRAKEGLAAKPVVKMDEVQANTVVMFELLSGSNLHLRGIALDGNVKSKKPTKYAFITSKENNLDHYNLFVDQCDIHSFRVKEGGSIFKAYKTSFADTIQVANSVIHHSFRGFSLADEKDDKGNYNVEYLILKNTVFKDIEQWAVDFYRGGNDESTLGGFLSVDHCVFDNVNDKENQWMIKQVGVVHCAITNSVFCNTPLAKAPVRLMGKYHFISNCCIHNAGRQAVSAGAKATEILYVNPKFVKKTNYQLTEGSPLVGKATDGGNIGLININ